MNYDSLESMSEGRQTCRLEQVPMPGAAALQPRSMVQLRGQWNDARGTGAFKHWVRPW